MSKINIDYMLKSSEEMTKFSTTGKIRINNDYTELFFFDEDGTKCKIKAFKNKIIIERSKEYLVYLEFEKGISKECFIKINNNYLRFTSKTYDYKFNHETKGKVLLKYSLDIDKITNYELILDYIYS